MKCAIGLDVGGTKTAGGIVSEEGQVLARRVIPTGASRGGEAVLQDALSLARDLKRLASGQNLAIAGIGVGVAELVDVAGEKVISSATIHWPGLPVRERFEEIAPAVLELDSRAAGLAEARFGAGRGLRSFLCLTVGTGIGSSWVVDGVPHRGARGSTGTVASSPLVAVCGECGAAVRPVLEEIASGPALVARYRKKTGKALDSAQEILARAAIGDAEAARVIAEAGEALGSVVALLVNVLDPQAVIVGGGLGSVEGAYREAFIASTRRYIWSETHRDLPILGAALGADGGWIGAAATAMSRIRRPGGS